MSKKYYSILGVPENATDQQIKQAYRTLAKRWHPDVNPNNHHAEEKFKEITEAYSVLSDPMLRSQYDMKLLRNEFYNGNVTWQEPEKEDRRDRRKTYSDDFISMLRNRSRTRSEANMKRRKKILVGMIVTFTIFMTWAMIFENSIEKRRQLESEAREQSLEKNSSSLTPNPTEKKQISDLDSPYDSIFGAPVFERYSPNEVVFISPFSDALICLVEADAPHRTIRNEFIHARRNFNMRELPNGRFRVKIYTGENWDVDLKTVNGFALGRARGGFTKDAEFFEVDLPPFNLLKPTYQHKNTNTSDTLIIDPTVVKMNHISVTDFFNRGD